MSVGVIFNPHARKNRRRERRLNDLHAAVLGTGTIRATETVEDIEAALRDFARNDVRYIVADGGDGATHWVVNEAIRLFGLEEASQRFVYVTSRGGTIDYLSRVIGMSGTPERIVEQLVDDVHRGRRPREVLLPTMCVDGEQRVGGRWTPFLRYGWASAVAGYGANFYGPWYRSDRGAGAARIVGLLAEGLATAAGAGMMRGPLATKKPDWLAAREHAFLRTMRGEVRVDGQVMKDAMGQPLAEYSVVHAGSVPLNLSGVLKVFGEATPTEMHVHVGNLRPIDVPAALAQAARGERIRAANFYDGRARTLDVVPSGDTVLQPCIDGELFDNVGALSLRIAAQFRFARVAV